MYKIAEAGLVKDFLNDNLRLPRTLDLYKEMIGKTQIEIYKQEDEVIRKLVRGIPKYKIVNDLKDTIPEGNFSTTDLDKFIERSDELHQLLKIDKSSAVKRYFNAKARCMEELAELGLAMKELVPKLQEKKDDTNTLRAMNSYKDLILNIMELEGWKSATFGNATQINISGDRIEKIKQRAHRADFLMKNAINENDKVSADKEDVKDEDADSE